MLLVQELQEYTYCDTTATVPRREVAKVLVPLLAMIGLGVSTLAGDCQGRPFISTSQADRLR